MSPVFFNVVNQTKKLKNFLTKYVIRETGHCTGKSVHARVW